MRIIQPAGARGSLKWIQRAVNEHWSSLEDPILAKLGATAIDWVSPVSVDQFAEYRDFAFLERVGHADLKAELKDFWPARGPQWDALGLTDNGDVLIVEAKAHIAEMCSPGTSAGPVSRGRIEATLESVAARMGARPDRAAWSRHFYQLANRIAHLDFLRSHGVPAWLVLANFLDDKEMGGPATAEAWEAAYQVAFHVMGLARSHPLSRYIVHVYPRIE